MSGTALGGSTAIRCSMRCSAATSRRAASWKRPWRGGKEGRQRYLPNTAILETIDRGRGRHDAHRRLRAALPPLRTHVPAADAGAPDRAGRRPAAGHAAPAADLQLRRAASRRSPAAAITRASSATLPCCGSRPTPDHLCPARNRIRARPADHPVRRRRREHHRTIPTRSRAASSPRPSPTGRLGARPQHPVRLAGGGDPRRDHAEALQLRGHRRGPGGADHLGARGRRHAAQLGLSLLLAARCVLHRHGAQPPVGDAHHGRLRALHRRHRRGRQLARRGRPDRAAVSHRARHRHRPSG